MHISWVTCCLTTIVSTPKASLFPVFLYPSLPLFSPSFLSAKTLTEHLFHYNTARWDFPGGPVVKTSHFHCRRCGFSPWLEKETPSCHAARECGMVKTKIKITFLKCQLILYLMRYFKMIIIIIQQSVGCSIPMWFQSPRKLKTTVTAISIRTASC